MLGQSSNIVLAQAKGYAYVCKQLLLLGVCNAFPVADPRGGGAAGTPTKIGSIFFLIQLFIRMLKNKTQIARESIKITLELPGPLSGPWTPAESEFGSALVMCVLAHNLLRPPK